MTLRLRRDALSKFLISNPVNGSSLPVLANDGNLATAVILRAGRKEVFLY